MKNYFNPTGKLDEDIFELEQDEDNDYDFKVSTYERLK